MNKKYISLSITIILTLFIFSMSLFSGSDSGEMSSGLSLSIKSLWDGIFVNHPISIDFLNSFVRKGAHVFEFFILGISYFYTAKVWGLSILKILSLGLLTGGLDEWIQNFTPDRAGRWIDVFIFDFGGFILGVGLMLLIFNRKIKIHPDDVLKDLKDQKISTRKAYRYLYQNENRLKFTNNAHFLKLGVQIPGERGVNKFLKVLFFLPLPLVLARIALVFVKDYQSDIFSKEDIKRLINTKDINITVDAAGGEKVNIKTF